MRRIILYAALILGSCGCVTTPAQERLLVSRHSSLVDTPSSGGTGFPITDDSWLTAWHVVEGVTAEQIIVGGWQVLEVIRLEGIDAAVLVTGLHGETPWPLADRATRPGEQVYKSGYGTGKHWWTEGIATDDGTRVALDVFYGDSGGPVFDAKGRVLGIIVSMEAYGYEGRIPHHCGILPMPLILDALPEGFFQDDPIGFPTPLPAPETPWELFKRLKKERLGD